MKLTAQNVNVGYGREPVVHNLSLNISTGDVLCLLGPNGSGKTTFFKALLGILKPSAGTILLDEKPIRSWSQLEYAKHVAFVPQVHVPPFPYSVIDVVMLGRTPYLGIFSAPRSIDRDEAAEILDKLRIGHLIEKAYTEISGGERQLVLIGRALMQRPRFLIMDEPLSHLDYGNQIRTLSRIRELAHENIAIIFTTHTPDHAFHCATRVAAMHEGELITEGVPSAVITESLLKKMYSVDVRIVNVQAGDGTVNCIVSMSQQKDFLCDKDRSSRELPVPASVQ